jgi:glycosyltransferase involved in cell wall biosynthesis
MRIAITGDTAAPGVLYRADHVGHELERRGHTVVWPDNQHGALNSERVAGCDVLFVYRFRNLPIQQLARLFLGKGVALVWDNDDDLLAIPKGSPLEAIRRPGFREEVFRDTITMANLAQVVTFASPGLAELYRSHGVEHTEVIENAPRAPARTGPARDDGTVVIGWVAAFEHRGDLDRMPIVEALREVQRRHPHVRVQTLGVDLGLEERYEYIEFLPFEDMLRHLPSFDIGIAPVADTPFNRARSSIKIKEYAAAGVPWLASPLTPYAAYGSGCGGRLVPDDGWVDALDSLVADATERRRLAAEAEAWVAGQRIEVTGDRWEEVLDLAVSRLRSRPPQPAVNPWRVATRRPAPRRT